MAYLHVQADNPWYNYYIADTQGLFVYSKDRVDEVGYQTNMTAAWKSTMIEVSGHCLYFRQDFKMLLETLLAKGLCKWHNLIVLMYSRMRRIRIQKVSEA